MKYILVTGGVMSGIGKGVVASSIGVILKQANISVTSIKIDPYINIDAGTFSPFEHGEVYVLDDGGEVDLDLGNYERFLDVTLHRDNNITTGKIYDQVINEERKGKYLGKTVQSVPHITDAIQSWVERIAKIPVSSDMEEPEVCIIELGGTIGDIEGMSFVEAFRQLQWRVGSQNFCSVHVSYLPELKGEHKTKPTQASVRQLRSLGINPDWIVCRSERPVDESVNVKISNFCHVGVDRVINNPDFSTIYNVPFVFQRHGFLEQLQKRLAMPGKLQTNKPLIRKWKELADRAEGLQKEVCIALVGKYTKHQEEAYSSVIKALRHASLAVKRKLSLIYIDAEDLEEEMKFTDQARYQNAWNSLRQCKGLIIPGGFGSRGVEGKIAAAHWARTNGKPFLGVCLGLQCAVIEFARNVLKRKDAHTTEINKHTTNQVVIDMPEHTSGDLGGTMRLGKRKTIFEKEQDSILRRLYGSQDEIEERHRHRYEVNPAFVDEFEAAGMKFVGRSTDKQRMEIMELSEHPFYVAVQYHPEFLSRPMKPSAPYLGLILAATDKLQTFLSMDNSTTSAPAKLAKDEDSSDNEDLDNLFKTMNISEKSSVTSSYDKLDSANSLSSIASEDAIG